MSCPCVVVANEVEVGLGIIRFMSSLALILNRCFAEGMSQP